MYRDIEELRGIAVSMRIPLEKLLYEMLCDAVETLDEIEKYIKSRNIQYEAVGEDLLNILEGDYEPFDNPLPGVPTFLDKIEERKNIKEE